MPEPFTDAAGPTVISGNDTRATLDVGPTILDARGGKGGRPGSSPRTAVPKHSGTTILSGDAREPRPARARTPVARPAPPPSSGSPVLYIVVGALGVSLLAAATFIYLNRRDPDPTTATTVAQAPPETTLPPLIAFLRDGVTP